MSNSQLVANPEPVSTPLDMSWVFFLLKQRKKNVREAGKQERKTKKIDTFRKVRNLEEGCASISPPVIENRKYKNTPHVSWPRARMHLLKRSELWTHISIPFHMCLEYVGAFPWWVTGETGSVEHAIFINGTRAQWFLNSQETLCLLVSAIYLYFHFIKHVFSSSRFCRIRHLFSCPRWVTQVPCPLDSDPWRWGQWTLSPLVPAKVETVVRMFVFVKKFEGLWTLLVILP